MALPRFFCLNCKEFVNLYIHVQAEVAMSVGSVLATSSLLATGVAGVQKGLATASDAAGKIAHAATSTDDLTTSIVDLKGSELLVKASAAVIKTADEIVGTLIDIKA